MHTTYTDIRDGKRFDIEVGFVTRRVLTCDGERVHRLLVADRTGATFPVLTTPNTGSPVGLRTGSEVRLSAMLGAAPVDSLDATDASCRDCGGRLRPGTALDTLEPTIDWAVSELELTGPFGVVDSAASILPVSVDRPVDDWIPTGPDWTGEVPDRVCLECGRHSVGRDDTAGRGFEHRAGNSGTGGQTTVGPRLASQQGNGLDQPPAEWTAGFRSTVARGYTPRPGAIRDERLLAVRGVEAGERVRSDGPFDLRCGAALTEHPVDGDLERYLAVGLESTQSVAAFERPDLDFVVVLDTTTTMDRPLDPGRGETTTLDAAARVVSALTEQLRDDDRFGVEAAGGTNLVAGVERAIDMLTADGRDRSREQRLLLVTDGLSGTGTADADACRRRAADAATRGVHTTVVGVGHDAHAGFATAVSDVRGATHRLVRSPAAFEQRLDTAFDRLVAPVAHDFTVEVDGGDVLGAQGCPPADVASDRIVHAGTVFPPEEGSTRVAVVLARLGELRANGDPEVVVRWTERGGGEHTASVPVEMPRTPETYTHDSLTALVALARYGRELRAWAAECHRNGVSDGDAADGLPHRGQHGGGLVPLTVPDRYAERFARLRAHLEDELGATRRRQRECDLLAALSRQAEGAQLEVER